MNPTEFVALAEGSDCSSDEELNTVSKHLAIIKVSHKQWNVAYEKGIYG